MLKFSINTLLKLTITFIMIGSLMMSTSDCWGENPIPYGKKVLVVMSYHQGYHGGEKEIKNVIDELLESAEVKYVYLDTKRNLQEGASKAKKAYELYKNFKPDAVIAANDNAQSLFVVPFLKDKTDVPVIFCGVNDDATKYGYPASNVTGVLEKKHYKESLELLKLVDDSADSIAILYKDNPTNKTNIATIREILEGSSLSDSEFHAVRSIAELNKSLENLQDKVDALLLLNMTGIPNSQGEELEAKEVVRYIAIKWKKPTVAAGSWEIEAGALCGVIQVDKNQGFSAVQMLFDIWSGKNIKDLHIIDNSLGRPMINVTTAKRLGLNIKPGILLSVKNVR